MNSTQRKVVEELKKIAKKKKVDADFEWTWGNLGHLYFRRGFTTVANLSMQFDGDTLALAFSKSAHKAEYFGHNDKLFYIHYNEGPKFDLLFKYILGAL